MYLLSISASILTFICGFGVLQGILLAGFIYFHKKSDKSVNIFLAFYIVCTSAIISLPFALKMVGWQHGYMIYWIPLLSGPLLYLYLKSFKEKITLLKIAPHLLLPALFFFLTYWNISRFAKGLPDTADFPGEILQNPVTIGIQLLRTAQQIFYYFLSRRTLISYQKSIRHLFSETSTIDLQWARYLVNGYLLLVLIFVAIYPAMAKFPDQFSQLLLINMAFATPYIYIATYKGIVQHTIWQQQPELKKEIVQEQIKEVEKTEPGVFEQLKTRQEKPALVNDKVDGLTQKITHLMEVEKIYLEPELTLQQLADKLQVPAYLISQALNEGMKKNFYDVVNGFRVEEAKSLLLDEKNKNYTILSVGFEAGFNSKTTFNTVFKKFTGHTPTAFREKNKKELMDAIV